MPEKIMVNFENIVDLLPKWNDYKMSGNVNLTFEEKKRIENVYKQIFNNGFCLHCPSEAAMAFEKVFIQYDKTKSETIPRSKRKRI